MTTFAEALEGLRKERGRGTREDRPDAIAVEDISICAAVFQPRAGDAERGEQSPAHVAELARHLEAKPKDRRTLDPVTVFANGRKFYAVDGHHRLGAYRAAGITAPIPVRHFPGTLEEAVQESIRLNSKVHLNLDRGERNEAAWRLTVLGEESTPRIPIPTIAEASGVSESTAARMRKLYRLLQDKLGTLDDFTGEFVPARFNSYREAMRAAKEGERGEFTEEMQAAMIDKMVQAFGTAFGKQAHRHPAMFGEALKEYLGEHGLGRMNEHLGFARVDSEEHERFLDWRDSGHL